MPTLVLWDIDGTLLKGSRVATAAFERALREVYEIEGALARVEYGGKTDSQIALEVVALHQIAEPEALERLERFHHRYIGMVREQIDELRATVQALPGVHELVDALDAAGARQSLLTGNLRPTAELKLQAAGLHELFDFEIGAYGSDHRSRDELVPIARRRARARFGRVDRVVVVGDTPRDIACGKAGGARTVAVATGNWSMEELARHAPDALLPDLSDTNVALAAIVDA